MCVLAASAAEADDLEVRDNAGTITADTGTAGTATAATVTAGQGAKGLAFSVPSGGGPTFGGAYFLRDNAALRLDLGLEISSKETMPGGDRQTSAGISVELGYRMYKGLAGKLTTFVQPSAYLAKSPGVDMGDALSAAVTAAFGVEYWFSPQWSVSGATGVALQARANAMGSFKDISLTSGTTSLTAAFYWR